MMDDAHGKLPGYVEIDRYAKRASLSLTRLDQLAAVDRAISPNRDTPPSLSLRSLLNGNESDLTRRRDLEQQVGAVCRRTLARRFPIHY